MGKIKTSNEPYEYCGVIMLETHLFGSLHVLGKHNGIVVVCPRFPPLSFRLLAPEAGSTRTCAHMPLKPWQGEAGPAWGGGGQSYGHLLGGEGCEGQGGGPSSHPGSPEWGAVVKSTRRPPKTRASPLVMQGDACPETSPGGDILHTWGGP